MVKWSKSSEYDSTFYRPFIWLMKLGRKTVVKKSKTISEYVDAEKSKRTRNYYFRVIFQKACRNVLKGNFIAEQEIDRPEIALN